VSSIFSFLISSDPLIVRVNEVFEAEGEKGRKQSKLIATPPYVTARPDVSFRKIHRPNEKLKFVILATDGRMSPFTISLPN
jgi:hypothetical protein